MPVEKAYWTIEELAAYLGFAKSTIYKWTSKRQIPYTKKGGTVRFHIERTKAWWDKREVQPKK